MEEKDKIREISIRELKGGRSPMQEEIVKFEPAVRRDLKKQRTNARIYIAVGFLIIAGCAVRTFAFGNMTPMESILYGFIALAAGGIGLVSIRTQMHLRILYGMFMTANYVVWGCTVRETKGEVGKPLMQVKVTTLAGEACEGWFVTDTASAREAEKGLPHEFWLLAFPRGNKVAWSKLISDGMTGKDE